MSRSTVTKKKLLLPLPEPLVHMSLLFSPFTLLFPFFPPHCAPWCLFPCFHPHLLLCSLVFTYTCPCVCVCILCCCVVSCHMLRVCLHASVASAGLSLFFFFLFPFVCRYLVLLGGSGGPVCLCFLSACVFSLSMWGWVVGSRPSLSLCCFSLSLFCSLSLAFHLTLSCFSLPTIHVFCVRVFHVWVPLFLSFVALFFPCSFSPFSLSFYFSCSCMWGFWGGSCMY